jgi:hypothetical protein
VFSVAIYANYRSRFEAQEIKQFIGNDRPWLSATERNDLPAQAASFWSVAAAATRASRCGFCMGSRWIALFTDRACSESSIIH